ncbi:putative PIN2/TERF1-interacting telomerase inhibitor 1 [Hypsibius exemplaris]|uniref:PIN2/TERF1-interacting telomerase inhibitor 1 n=1 Tax=Hypsibius exemplaris TaxID=2072580 RepID=A0A1W0WCC3_HYPEX|nr:putative PIN2/TERF1-interacting telomerase inhibitor 1 [Hypsibius exemplaris]
MSLLAGPKRKQQISVNPQGKTNSDLWKQYGTKLMEKAGWADGDGLGTGRQGATEHLQMQFKDDNRGLGCTIEYEKNWLAHGDDFNDLLASLNAHHGNTAVESSGNATAAESVEERQAVALEKKSKGAKGRIHYHKFTRGKDLSSRSADEISKIFGGNMPGKKKKSVATENDDSISPEDSVPKEEKVTGLKTFQSGDNIHDYFAKKMALKKMGSSTATPVDSAEASRAASDEDEAQVMPTFALGHAKRPTDEPTIEEPALVDAAEPVARKKKSKKRKSEAIDAEEVAPPGEAVAPPGEAVAPPGEEVASLGEAVAPPGEASVIEAEMETAPGDAPEAYEVERELKRKLRAIKRTEKRKLERVLKKAQKEDGQSVNSTSAAVAPVKEDVPLVEEQAVTSTEEPVESKEERRARKLARREERARLAAAENELTRSGEDMSIVPASVEAVVVSRMAAAASVASPPVALVAPVHTNGVSSSLGCGGDRGLMAGSTSQPTFATSLHFMRHQMKTLAPDARAAMFPGSNIFEIVGYGDELFF